MSEVPDRLGSYQVVNELGRGGMGVVYQAEDPRLKRQVAIKVLPENLARDVALLGRFEREAQLLAALNHPNIATIHSLEEAEGVHFLTMEYVEGDTLQDRVHGGPLPVDDALQISRQIANALEAAHKKGIIHRDLKPLNVKITPDGEVKVLDFGLAKALHGEGPRRRPPEGDRRSDTAPGAGPTPGSAGGARVEPAGAPGEPGDEPTRVPGGDAADGATLAWRAGGSGGENRDETIVAANGDVVDRETAWLSAEDDLDETIGPELGTRPLGTSVDFAETLAGDILGTPGYMSPEQVNGYEVDHRADIFAFGCVVWECLTGCPAFRGENLDETLSATLTRRLDFDLLPPATPVRVRDLIAHCLARNPNDRLGEITEARHAIEEEIAQRAMPTSARARPERSGPNNLPVQLTSFVGRRSSLAEVKHLVAENRLVTLSGAGGSGKTRLAIEVGWNCLADFGDGVWRVELAPLTDPSHLAPTVASVLGLKEEPGRGMEEVLAEHLSGREQVLILDNCEHLLDACARLAQTLLASAPGLTILATSVETLGITGETVYHVPLLSLPVERASFDEIRSAEAVRLFSERAAAARTGFELTEDNAGAIAQICRRLDGIPLALELAAARVKVLAPGEIAERLDDRFRLLTSRDKTALPRHKTLRALIDWSYDHLDEAEQALLSRLSVFSGGWTLDATELVCAGGDVEEWDVLDLLSDLVDKSLVSMDTDRSMGTDRARYQMLETVRAYAAERLEERREAADTRGRHRRFYADLAEEIEPNLTGRDQAIWLLRLDADHDNFRGALTSTGGDEPELDERLRLAGALGRYWTVRGYWSEGRSVTSDLLESARTTEPTAAHGKVLHLAGNLAYKQGDYEQARELHVEGLAIRRRVGDHPGVAASLDSLGAIADASGDLTQALQHLKESLAIRRGLGDRWAIAVSLNNVGVATENAGDYETARGYHEESLAIRRELGEPTGIAGSLNNLGTTLESLRELDASCRCHREALEIRRELGDRWGIGLSLKNLGRVLVQQGELAIARPLLEESVEVFREIGERHELSQTLGGLGEIERRESRLGRASALFRESLQIRRELGEPRGVAASLEAIGAVTAARGDHATAAQLLGVAEAMRSEIDVPRWPMGQQRAEELIDAVVEALGEKGLERARTHGRSADRETVIDSALLLAARSAEGIA